MTRLIVLLVLAGVAVGIALLLQRRRPDPPSAPSYRAPAQLDRDDFGQPHVSFLAVVFASTACSTCPDVWSTVQAMATERLAVERVDVEHTPKLHERYRIDGVPTTVFADADGVVTHTYFGPVTDEELQQVRSQLGAD